MSAARAHADYPRDLDKSPVHTEPPEKFHELIQAVAEHGKGGTVTFKITVAPQSNMDGEMPTVTGERGRHHAQARAQRVDLFHRRSPQPHLPRPSPDGYRGHRRPAQHSQHRNRKDRLTANTEHHDNIQVATKAGRELGARHAELVPPEGRIDRPAMVRPVGDIVSLRYLLNAPLRKRGRPTFPAAPCFAGYANDHKGPSAAEADRESSR